MRMMIRYSQGRRGVSLVEMAYALLIVGFVLAIVWTAAAAVYRNYHTMQAGRQLNIIVQNLRIIHPLGKLDKNENLGLIGLPSDMIGHYKGNPIVINTWLGSVTAFPGNAIGWGDDTVNDEFTIRFDDVPQSACASFAMKSSSRVERGMGLVAVYISPLPMRGKEVCFAVDSYCKNTIQDLTKEQAEFFCKGNNRMTVMFTYMTH